jgi:hypothetical protein
MSEQTNSRTERVLDELIEAAERVGVKVRRAAAPAGYASTIW